jgi:hypothetical protein
MVVELGEIGARLSAMTFVTDHSGSGKPRYNEVRCREGSSTNPKTWERWHEVSAFKEPHAIIPESWGATMMHEGDQDDAYHCRY